MKSANSGLTTWLFAHGRSQRLQPKKKQTTTIKQQQKDKMRVSFPSACEYE
jgi:hypothetical protein